MAFSSSLSKLYEFLIDELQNLVELGCLLIDVFPSIRCEEVHKKSYSCGLALGISYSRGCLHFNLEGSIDATGL